MKYMYHKSKRNEMCTYYFYLYNNFINFHCFNEFNDFEDNNENHEIQESVICIIDCDQHYMHVSQKLN